MLAKRPDKMTRGTVTSTVPRLVTRSLVASEGFACASEEGHRTGVGGSRAYEAQLSARRGRALLDQRLGAQVARRVDVAPAVAGRDVIVQTADIVLLGVARRQLRDLTELERRTVLRVAALEGPLQLFTHDRIHVRLDWLARRAGTIRRLIRAEPLRLDDDTRGLRIA